MLDLAWVLDAAAADVDREKGGGAPSVAEAVDESAGVRSSCHASEP